MHLASSMSSTYTPATVTEAVLGAKPHTATYCDASAATGAKSLTKNSKVQGPEAVLNRQRQAEQLVQARSHRRISRLRQAGKMAGSGGQFSRTDAFILVPQLPARNVYSSESLVSAD